MNDGQVMGKETGTNSKNDGFGAIDALIVLARHKRKLIVLPVVVAVLSAAVSLALPDVYRAGTKLLPPQQAQSATSAILSQSGGLAAGAVGGMVGLKNPNDLYVGMLKSRTIADRIVERFELKRSYDLKSNEKTRKKLEDRTFISAGKDGLITIEVEDENPARVAKMANAYVEELYKLSKVLAVTEASKRRMFFESQLETAKNNLASAEVALKGALDTHGVISVDNESRAIVETVGRLRAQISAKEIQLSSMNAFFTENNPEYKRTQQELFSLRNELSNLENGRAGLRKDQAGTKQEGLENIKVLRDVKYYQMLYELLAKQYETSRLDEAKDPSVIQVLDPAVQPEKKFRPKRAIITLAAVFLALVVSIIWVLVSEVKNHIDGSSKLKAQFAELKGNLKFRP
ncbi:GumC family protein [Massilia norwichensis]|uniref:Wzz/FepE/Etk N-terminal domain-containing protein n=1 Tax=Massilia norwichensis TaxID=1442366 RepID=A0ABT2A5D5_9BURK|nr:GNVR domain-containing protein [Massilia norwichensis]MCS0589412.1 Wzz/FepE/Etk N-terminal domain-containing protein [Massilia norwichensis]